MFRSLLLLVLVWLVLPLPLSWAQDEADHDDGPLISITSPDGGTTFAYGSIKDHTLIWNKKTQTLIARVTFTDAEQNSGSATDDTHDFRLPGISFDEKNGVFYATSAKGETIPVAHYSKSLFFVSIATLPNARVRVLHPRGNLTVILEAISPSDPALHAAPGNGPEDRPKVEGNKILN